ncbi:RTA-like protein [Metarhizium robertsii ARSEF 23]|uniref:RTA-like protein n=1 Tax=Metarhizium robertsii (strain ARSEF 23 / ATCC MYA-3075) TaxID=655844 RepID=E9FCR5_METRA|nr:RTA-like protein [Metarhizium robertsii ARSEF 23]EFY94485.2 RTA-like protein [Metarhizium robertsii ARSEF 23]
MSLPTDSSGTLLVPSLDGTIIPYFRCNVDTCSLSYAQVQYQPSESGNLTYLIIFAVLLLAQSVLGIIYRTWGFSIAMVLGLVLEVIGYVGRLQMHNDPFKMDPFLIYLICLTIGPAFLSAAVYLSLSRLIVVHGAYLARFAPRTYTIIFVTCDVVSLALQATGGAFAATDGDSNLKHTGVNVMIAGLSFQVASLWTFIILSGDFGWRLRGLNGVQEQKASKLRMSTMVKAFPWATGIATIAIFIRCVYRLAELQEGFAGKLANDEVLFMIFEGPMITLAAIAITIFHPGFCFKGAWGSLK